MKFFRTSLITLTSFALLSTSSALAVTAAIKVTQVKPILSTTLSGASGDDIASVTSTANAIVVVGTVEGPGGGWVASPALGSSDGYIAAIDLTGHRIWDLRLGTVLDDIATAVTQDSAGNYWVVGASTVPLPATSPSPAPTATIANPDGVLVDPVPPIQTALTRLELWSISPVGELISTYSLDTSWSTHPQSITFDGAKLAIAGEIAAASKIKHFAVNFTLGGNFGLLVQSLWRQSISSLNESVGTSTWKSLISSGPILGIPTWKPKTPTQVLLRYAKSGKLTDARFFVGTPLALHWQKEIGLILMSARNGRFGLTIVTPLAG